MFKTDKIVKRCNQILRQIKDNWKDAALSGIAASVAWFISARLLGHSHPIFASMSALICIAPALPNRGKQAYYVLIGVLTGVFVGELTLLLPPLPLEIRIAIVGFLGLLIGSAYAVIPAIIIQAGVSSIMVLAMGADIAGFNRVFDVIIGTGIGFLFSQVLFTPDPIKALRSAVERFFRELYNNYSLAADALEKKNPNLAFNALKTCNRTQIALINLMTTIEVARYNTRWTLRGRFVSKEVTALSVRYDQAAIRLYAITLLFTESLANALRKDHEPAPDFLSKAIHDVVENCRIYANLGGQLEEIIIPDRTHRTNIPLSWRDCINNIEMAENTLAKFYKSRTRKARIAAHRRQKLIETIKAEVSERQKLD